MQDREKCSNRKPSDRQSSDREVPDRHHLTALRAALAAESPTQNQEALREVLSHAAHLRTISFDIAARVEAIGWVPADQGLAQAVRLAQADLLLTLLYPEAWPPDEDGAG